MTYAIVFEKNIKKQLKSIPLKDSKKIIELIESLADEPRPNGAERLQGRRGYRIRYGNYRIVYAIDDGKLIIYVIDVDHRKDIYR